MGKQQRKKAAKAALAVPPKFEGTPEEHIAYLHQKIMYMQELLDTQTRKVQRIQKRDIQLGKLSDQHEEQIEQLEEEHEKQIEAIEERHEREFEKLTKRQEQEIEELEARQDREVDKLESKYKDIFSDDESDEDDLADEKKDGL